MHGDRMKKNIKVNYKSIFKYDDHHETVNLKVMESMKKDLIK